jgi:hypothetical protein
MTDLTLMVRRASQSPTSVTLAASATERKRTSGKDQEDRVVPDGVDSATLLDVGLFIGWFVRGRWFFVAGFAIVILALVMPWPNGIVRQVVLWLGIAIMAVQVVVIARVAHHHPGPPDPD